MRFFCDEMLQRLGRWLRAAGYDTLIASHGMPDRTIIEQAADDDRLLLTRDRKLAEFRQAKDCVVWLAGNDVHAQALEIGQRFGIDWLHAPFSRCLVCNTQLETATPDRWQHVPALSREYAEALYVCPDCGHLYWHGSHVRRMRARLRQWQDHLEGE